MEGAEPPQEWLISRICEEFGCLPSEALHELLDGPAGLVLDVMELRDYARTKQAIDSAQKEGDAPTGAMADQVWKVQHELLRRRNAGRRK